MRQNAAKRVPPVDEKDESKLGLAILCSTGGKSIKQFTDYETKELQKNLFGERTHAWFPKDQLDRTHGPESAPEVLALRAEIYRGLERWEWMQEIAQRSAVV
jgi:hypothetical protein